LESQVKFKAVLPGFELEKSYSVQPYKKASIAQFYILVFSEIAKVTILKSKVNYKKAV
jgi:hypothetical protein